MIQNDLVELGDENSIFHDTVMLNDQPLNEEEIVEYIKDLQAEVNKEHSARLKAMEEFDKKCKALNKLSHEYRELQKVVDNLSRKHSNAVELLDDILNIGNLREDVIEYIPEIEAMIKELNP